MANDRVNCIRTFLEGATRPADVGGCSAGWPSEMGAPSTFPEGGFPLQGAVRSRRAGRQAWAARLTWDCLESLERGALSVTISSDVTLSLDSGGSALRTPIGAVWESICAGPLRDVS